MADGKEYGDTVNEARIAWEVPHERDPQAWLPLMDSKLSTKNQITLPVALTRALDWRAGDEVSLMVHGDMVILNRLPRNEPEWGKWLAGSVDVPEWRTKEGIDAWLKNEREDWESNPN